MALHRPGSSAPASRSFSGTGDRKGGALNDLGSSEINLLELSDEHNDPEVKEAKTHLTWLTRRALPETTFFFLYLKMSQNNTFLFLANFSIFFNVLLEGLFFFLNKIILRIYNFFFFKFLTKYLLCKTQKIKKMQLFFLVCFEVIYLGLSTSFFLCTKGNYVVKRIMAHILQNIWKM